MKMLKIIALILSVSSLFLLCSCSSFFSKDDATVEKEIEALKSELKVQNALVSSLLAEKKEENTPIPDQTPENTPSEETKEEFDFIENSTGVTITRYNGNATTVKIPEQLGGKNVTQIGQRAFEDSKVKTVSLPTKLEYIDWFAFYSCYALTTVYIPESVREIGYGAFDGCSKRLTLYSTSGSYTERFAKSFGITFSPVD